MVSQELRQTALGQRVLQQAEDGLKRTGHHVGPGIQTLDDVMKIQQEGREKRQAAEADMRRMENELKTKLLEIRR